MNSSPIDHSAQKDRDRLTAIGDLSDTYTKQRLTVLGVSEGWHCLEVGFGAGSIALWLADKVGSSGRVVATDLDPQFLGAHGRANLGVRKHDLATDPLEEAAFDLAHARTVLEWVPDRQRALARMASAVRPGGWVVVEDHDIGGVMTAALAHYTEPPQHAQLYERIIGAVAAAVRDLRCDPGFGGQLVKAFTDAGLVNIAAEVHTPLIAGGTSNLNPLIVEFLAEHMLSTFAVLWLAGRRDYFLAGGPA